jgi:REP element-mobilizing transposase RayT
MQGGTHAMPSAHTELYLHLVWSTLQRHPFITAELQPRIFGAICDQCRKMKADVIAIGGMPDHTHLLLRSPPTISVAEIAQRVKGASSHVANQAAGARSFRWQDGYGAFTVSRSILPRVRAYVLDQERHHLAGTLSSTFELTSPPPR